MIVIGIDAHKRTHTASPPIRWGNSYRRKPLARQAKTTSRSCNGREGKDDECIWAIEDCRHLSRRLERNLIASGERVVRVPPKLMAHARDSARSYGKSDPIDALAVARAALREPDLPVARLDGVEREIRLLVDHREDLVGSIIARLRWHLHELDPGWTQPAKMDRASAFVKVEAHVSDLAGLVTDLAARLVDHLRRLTVEFDELAAEITSRTTVLAPSLLAIPGCGALTAAKILGETAQVGRFHSKDGICPPQRQPHRYRCGRRVMLDIVSRAQGTGRSMPAFIGLL